MEKKEMTWEEREEMAAKRMHNDKYIVFSYHPDKDGQLGSVEKLPQPNNYGWSWNPSACIHTNLDFKFEVNAYWDNYTEDEDFNPNKIERWKIFTSKEKATKYSEDLKKYLTTPKITLNDILNEVRKIDKYKECCIVNGKRGYENCSKSYDVVLLDAMTYLKVYNDRYILYDDNFLECVIPHIDAVKLALQGDDIDFNFMESKYHWDKHLLR